MKFETVDYRKDGPLAWISLNRPEKLNAINRTMLRELRGAMDRAQLDDEIRVGDARARKLQGVAGVLVVIAQIARLSPDFGRQGEMGRPVCLRQREILLPIQPAHVGRYCRAEIGKRTSQFNVLHDSSSRASPASQVCWAASSSRFCWS